MLREFGRNSFLNFLVVLILIMLVAALGMAQRIGAGQQLAKPSALAERTKSPQLSVLPLDDGTLGANQDGSDIMTSNATAIIPDTRIFRWPTVYDSGGQLAQSVAVADLNADVKPDLVVVNYDGSVGVLLGKGNGSFLPAVAYGSGGSGPTTIVIRDLNADSKPDLLVANQGCPGVNSFCVGVLLGKGDGTFQAAVVYAYGGWSWAGGPTPMMISDVNSDTKPDLVVVSQTDKNYGHGFLSVLLGNGDGTFKAVTTYDSGGFAAFSGMLSDVNGDGRVDAVVGNCAASGSTDCFTTEAVVGVLLGNGDGTFQSARKYGTGGVGGFWVPLVVADVSSDGKPDILVGNYCLDNNCAASRGSLGVLLGHGDGTFQPVTTYRPGGGGVVSIALADLNGDGELDVTVGSPIGVFLGNGNGTFRYLAAYPTTGGAGRVLLADLNRDKATDVVGINGSSNTADVLLGNGDGTFQEPQNFKLGGSEFSWATLADVNFDGKPDLVSANWCCRPYLYEEGTVGVLLNIVKYATATTLASSLNPSIYGQKITWTATVTTSGSVLPTGNVVFRWSRDGQNHQIGTAPLNTSGVAMLTRSMLNVPLDGAYPINAVYVGDTMNLRSTSGMIFQDVLQAKSMAAITSSLNPSVHGQPVTFIAKITSPTVTPTGPVTFTAGSTVLGTAQLSAGKARFTVSVLPAGSTILKVTYFGSSNVAKSSASVTQIVH